MKRQTLQKAIILDALKQLGNHPTPAMVYDAIHEKYPSISKATVFRVLAGECEDGNAQKVMTPVGGSRYEFGTREHYHVTCRICGRLADIDSPMPSDLKFAPIACDGFEIESFYVEFIGLCPDCKGSETKNDENII